MCTARNRRHGECGRHQTRCQRPCTHRSVLLVVCDHVFRRVRDAKRKRAVEGPAPRLQGKHALHHKLHIFHTAQQEAGSAINNAAGEGGGHRYASAAQGADLRTGAACAWNFRRLNVTFSPWVTGSSSYSSPPSPSPSPAAAASPAMSTATPSFCHHANTRTHTQGAECEHVARSHRAPPPRDSSRPSTRTFSSPSSLGVAASSSAAFIASAAHKPVLTCTEIRAAAQVRIRNVRATDTLRPPH